MDDDRVLRERLARAIRDRGFDVRTAGDAEEALAEIVPVTVARARQDELGRERILEQEATAGAQGPRHAGQEGAVPGVVEVREAVAQAEGRVELVLPRRRAHVADAQVELEAALARALAPLLDQLGAGVEADVHMGVHEPGSDGPTGDVHFDVDSAPATRAHRRDRGPVDPDVGPVGDEAPRVDDPSVPQEQ